MLPSGVKPIGLLILAATLMLLHVGCSAAAAPAPAATPGAPIPLAPPPTPPPGAPAQEPVAAPPTVVTAARVGLIEVNSSVGLVRSTVPGGTLPVPLGQGVLQVVVSQRFPEPGAVRVRVEPVDAAAEAAPWQVERQDPPAPDEVAFRLHGGRPGRVAVALEADGAPPVRFTLDVTEIPILGFPDHGKVLRLGVGDRFILEQDFSRMREVKVRLMDPSVLHLLRERDDGRPPLFFPGREIHIQNEYQAARPGRTTLRVYGAVCCGSLGANTDSARDIEVR